MDAIPPSDPSHYGMVESSPYRFSHDRLEEASRPGSSWYFSRKEIEENSPSRRDGIDLKKETYLRKSYCTYLQDLGMRLKVPQVTIATAIVFCHRFFLRQSHLKNDRREVYEQQKELILLGERVVLATLGFDFNVHHPYKPLVEAIKKFKVAQNALAQVAWNFVNDGLRTSLCLQFKPHHIAAGAIFLAAKFLKVKLPSDGEKVWWQEFDVTPRQLEEVSNQMLELYEQNRLTQQSHGNETEGSSASGAHHHAPVKAPFPAEEPPAQNGYSQATKPSSLQHSVPSMLTHAGHEQSQSEKQNGTQRLLQNENNDYASNKIRSGPGDSKMELGTKDHWHHDQGNIAGTYEGRSSRYESECPVEESTAAATGGSDGTKERTSNCTEGPKNFSPMMDAMKKIDKDKVKAALEKRRKSKGDVARKIDLTDEDDLIERELEHGVELAVEDEKIKQERRQSWSKTLYREGPKNSDHVTENGNLGHEKVTENTEEGELSMDSQDFRSPEPGSHKRKAMSPGKQFGGRDGYDAQHYNRAPTSNYHDGLDDARSVGRFERAEREHKRFRHES